MADDKEVEKTIAEDLVVTKYKLAGQIVNRKYLCHLIYMCIWYLSLYLPRFRIRMSTGRVSQPCGQYESMSFC